MRLLLLCFLFFIFSKAFAHQPKLIKYSPSKENPHKVIYPEISKAYYGKLSGEAHYYIINSEKDFLFYAGILSCIYGLLLLDSIMISAKDIWFSFLLGVPQLAIGFIFITIGSRTTPAVMVGLLMLMETIFAPIWVWLFYSEIPPLSVLIGGLIIISAVVMKSLDYNKKV